VENRDIELLVATAWGDLISLYQNGTLKVSAPFTVIGKTSLHRQNNPSAVWIIALRIQASQIAKFVGGAETFVGRENIFRKLHLRLPFVFLFGVDGLLCSGIDFLWVKLSSLAKTKYTAVKSG
jgi:hypothetical protein